MFNIIPDTEAFNERYTVIYPLGEFIIKLPDGQDQVCRSGSCL